MRHRYYEILKKMGEPLWWDEYGCPRYVKFVPDEAANIYADQVMLVLITCQNCEHPFRMCSSQSLMDRVLVDEPDLEERIEKNLIEFGDPPNIQCCPAGPTMTSTPRRVLEYWRRTGARHWVRDRKLEVPLDFEDYSDRYLDALEEGDRRIK